MYFYEVDCYDKCEDSCCLVFYSEVKLTEDEFNNICKTIFDKHATKGSYESWIDGNVVDWDMELEKYGLKPVKIESSYIANYNFE